LYGKTLTWRPSIPHSWLVGYAFAAVRVIADPAHRELPIAAMSGFQADGAVGGLAPSRNRYSGILRKFLP
jgi:hypothetical protein